jgi:hypothetical protein
MAIISHILKRGKRNEDQGKNQNKKNAPYDLIGKILVARNRATLS